MDLFKEIIPSLLNGKEAVINSDNEKEYPPYIVNKALSFHADCIMHANEMNMHFQLPAIMQYTYYFQALRKYKRQFQKWHKKSANPENFQMVKDYYNYSDMKTSEIMDLLSDSDIEKIKQKTEKGGIVK